MDIRITQPSHGSTEGITTETPTAAPPPARVPGHYPARQRLGAGKQPESPAVQHRKLRIALLGTRGIPASYSGFETFYEQLGVRLAQRGHSVTVYNRSHHVRYRDPTYKGVQLVRLPSIRTKHLDTISHTLLSMLHALLRGFDIYYVCIVGNSPACLLAKLFGCKVILNVDAADADREKWRGLAKTYIRWAERIACRMADVVIADSIVIRERYKEQMGRDTVFIPYGANPYPRERERGHTDVLERFGIEPDNYILFVSRLTPENKAHVLVEAFQRAQTGFKLVLVGDAPYAEEYKQFLDSLCGPDVIRTGYLFGREYRQISCHCRFFVLPSGIDGTRPVLLDQMGFGNCVLVRDGRANVEVIGAAGATFEGDREVESLVVQLEQLARDKDAVNHYRAKALARAQEAYSWDGVVDRYETLFQEIAC